MPSTGLTDAAFPHGVFNDASGNDLSLRVGSRSVRFNSFFVRVTKSLQKTPEKDRVA